MIVLLLALIIILIVFLANVINQQKVSNNTVIAFTGSLGTGKTYLGVRYALKQYKKTRFRYIVKKIFGKIPVLNKIICPYPLVKPYLFSNIPIRISKKKWSLYAD